MSKSAALDSCGCCDALGVAPHIHNAPGLPALRYRSDDHAGFLKRMLEALSAALPAGAGPVRTRGAQERERPLAALTARATDDPSIALLDASAVVADVLTFYQERIANEGFLRSATERRSVLELARAIGYELAPGVAANAVLAFAVEDAPGAPGEALVPRGTAVQSVPKQGAAPQVFETSADLQARAEWNRMRPRLTRESELAVLVDGSPATRKLCLVGKEGSFPENTPDLISAAQASKLHWLDQTAIEGALSAVPIRRVYFSEAAQNLKKGELILFAGRAGSTTEPLVLRVVEAVLETGKLPDGTPDAARKRVRVDLEPLPKAIPLDTPKYEIPYARIRFEHHKFARVKLGHFGFARAAIRAHVVAKVWRERDLHAFVGIHGWTHTLLRQAINHRPPPAPVSPQTGAFFFKDKSGFFGSTAGAWKILPETSKAHYKKGWDRGDRDHETNDEVKLETERAIWTNSQGERVDADAHAYLERPVPGVVAGSWTVFESASAGAAPYAIHDGRETARADYALSGKALAVWLADESGKRLAPPFSEAFGFRSSSAHVGSTRLELVEPPLDTPVDGSAVELDGLVLGLQLDQLLVFQGERADLAGIEATEVTRISEILHGGGHTTLFLETPLAHSYLRERLTICANVVAATHGETLDELLGSGDGALANQRFPLRKPPLTHVSAPTPSGRRSTLDVRVNGVLWENVPSLYGRAASDPVYAVRIDDEAQAQLVFGDGVHGARLPSGAANVSASYRSGSGPAGEVDANSLTLLRSLPLGIRGVRNPLPAGGAEAAERLADARRNAPLTVLTFERVVSARDVENFGRTFSGIGKARADRLWVAGRELVYLTVAGATGGAADAKVLASLRQAVKDASDGSLRVEIGGFAQRYFRCSLRVVVSPRFVVAAVLEAVRARVQAAYCFEARDLGEPVTATELLARVHEVAGVVAVDLDALALYDDQQEELPTAAPPPVALPALSARWQEAARTNAPAELLLVNPVAIEVVEMAP